MIAINNRYGTLRNGRDGAPKPAGACQSSFRDALFDPAQSVDAAAPLTRRRRGPDMFPKSLRLEVIGLLCLKALALTAIYFLFIAPHAGPEPGGDATRAHLLSSQSH